MLLHELNFKIKITTCLHKNFSTAKLKRKNQTKTTNKQHKKR